MKKITKKTILFVLFLLLFQCMCFTGKSQYLLGISNSNYAGTNAIYINPSTIAGNRYTFYLNLVSADGHLVNSMARYNAPFSLYRLLTNTAPSAYKDSTGRVSFKKDYLESTIQEKSNFLGSGADIRLPSLSVSLGRKSALAISSRIRSSLYINNVSKNLAEMALNIPFEIDFTNIYGKKYSDPTFNIHANIFSEIGLSFGQVIVEEGITSLKFGATVKQVSGWYTEYFSNQGEYFQLNSPADGSVRATLELGGNTNTSYGVVGDPEFFLKEQFTKRPIETILGIGAPGKGLGFDLGFTYEFRPRYEEYLYTMDGKEQIDQTKNIYAVKVGVAVTDIGRVTYKNAVNYVLENKNSVKINFDNFEDVKSAKDAQNSIAKSFNANNPSRSTTFYSTLPTCLNLTVDYRIIKNTYLNLTWIQSLRGKNTIGMRTYSLVSITPRFELPWFEASIPISLMNNYREVAYGAMLRTGNFFVGSDNVGGIFNIGKLTGFNLYAGICIPIYKTKPKDRDKDGVSNKRDECRDVPGLWEFRGCPDTDGDGIEDREDACPTLAGLKEFGGCPDSDGDKIPDSKDECPTVAGLAEFGGCPDTDGDKIVDHKDDCPTEAGLLKFNGCPDTDNDGIMNKLDECPNDAGPIEFKGCPDRDGDGLPDKDDKCPDQAGPKEFNGCPDRDKDGVLDMVDQCPDTPGLAQYNGCPDRDMDTVPDQVDKCPDTYGAPENAGCPLVKVVEKVTIIQLAPEEAKVLKEAFDNLEFETGKAIIKEESFPSLGELADLLQKKTSYRLLASGHTDNVGKADANLKLSKKRAEAIKTYLIERGVDSDQIVTEGFGSKRPISSNKTAKGRQKNRRVELKIIK